MNMRNVFDDANTKIRLRYHDAEGNERVITTKRPIKDVDNIDCIIQACSSGCKYKKVYKQETNEGILKITEKKTLSGAAAKAVVLKILALCQEQAKEQNEQKERA